MVVLLRDTLDPKSISSTRTTLVLKRLNLAAATREAMMLIWACLLVLAGCAAALIILPLDAGVTEVVALVFAAAAFTAICAIEARHQK